MSDTSQRERFEENTNSNSQIQVWDWISGEHTTGILISWNIIICQEKSCGATMVLDFFPKIQISLNLWFIESTCTIAKLQIRKWNLKFISLHRSTLFRSTKHTDKPIRRKLQIHRIDKNTFQSVINLKFRRAFWSVAFPWFRLHTMAQPKRAFQKVIHYVLIFTSPHKALCRPS